MKNLKSCVLSIFVAITIITSCNCAQAKGKFIELDFVQDQLGDPIAFSEHEIFFPGGGYNHKIKQYDTARIYDVNIKKLTDTGAVMNVPRVSYGSIKYDDNHILIVGGACVTPNSIGSSSCDNVAEIYNIKDNKFTRIPNTNLSYQSPKMALLQNGKIFLLSGVQFEIFDPTTKKFSVLTEKGKYINYLHQYMYTRHQYASSNFFELNKDEILIFGLLSGYPTYNSFKMEIFNQITKKSTNISVDYQKLTCPHIGTPIQIDDGSILFIGAGKEKKDVIKFDPKTKEFTYYNRLSKSLCGLSICLTKDLILFLRGGLSNPDYIRGTMLVRAVYDHKKNKIYDWKKARAKELNHCSLLKLNMNTVVVSTYKEKLLLYKY